jgi:hypothetical protein
MPTLLDIVNRPSTINWSNPSTYRSPDIHSSITQTPSAINPFTTSNSYFYSPSNVIASSGGSVPLYRSGLTGEQISYDSGRNWVNTSGQDRSFLNRIVQENPINIKPQQNVTTMQQSKNILPTSNILENTNFYTRSIMTPEDVMASGNLISAATIAVTQPKNIVAQQQFSNVLKQQQDRGYLDSSYRPTPFKPPEVKIEQLDESIKKSKIIVPPVSGFVSPELRAIIQAQAAEGTFIPRKIQVDQKITMPISVSPTQIKGAFDFIGSREGVKSTQEYKDIVDAYGRGVLLSYQQKLATMTADERAAYKPTAAEIDVLTVENKKITGDPKLDFKGNPMLNPYLTDSDRDSISSGKPPEWFNVQQKTWQSGVGPVIEMATSAAASVSSANAIVKSLADSKKEFDSQNIVPQLDIYNKTAADLKASIDRIESEYAPLLITQNGKKVLPPDIYPYYEQDLRYAKVDELVNTLKTMQPDLDKNIKKSDSMQQQIDTAYNSAVKKYDSTTKLFSVADAAITEEAKGASKYYDMYSKASIPTIAYIQKYGFETPTQLASKLREVEKVKKADEFNITYKQYLDVTGANATPDMLGYKELVTEAPTTENEIKRYQAITGPSKPFKIKDVPGGFSFGVSDSIFPDQKLGEKTKEISPFEKGLLFIPGLNIGYLTYKSLTSPNDEILSSSTTTAIRENVLKPAAPYTFPIVNSFGEGYQLLGKGLTGFTTGQLSIDQQVQQAKFASDIRDRLEELKNMKSAGTVGKTIESRINLYEVSNADFGSTDRLDKTYYNIYKDVKSMVLAGKGNDVDTKYTINVPKAQSRELEYKTTMQTAGDITALAAGFVAGGGALGAIPKYATYGYYAAGALTSPEITDTLRTAESAITLGAGMKLFGNLGERVLVKKAGPRIATETDGYRTLATAVEDTVRTPKGQMKVKLSKEPITGGIFGKLGYVTTGQGGPIGGKLPIGAPATELGFSPTVNYVPKSAFWSGVEGVTGTISKYGFPAAYGAYVVGEEAKLADIAKTQGVQAYETARQKFISDMAAFNLAMPIGDKIVGKTLANYNLKTEGLKKAAAAETPYVVVKTKATTLGPETTTRYEKIGQPNMPKERILGAYDLARDPKLTELKPGKLTYEGTVIENDKLSQTIFERIIRKFDLAIGGNRGGKAYGGDTAASRRALSDFDALSFNNPLKLRTEGMVKDQALREWARNLKNSGFTVSEGPVPGKAKYNFDYVKGEVTYLGKHLASVHPYSDSIKGLIGKYQTWGDTLRGAFIRNPDGIRIIGAKEQLIRKLDMRPEDIFDIGTYYGPEYGKMVGKPGFENLPDPYMSQINVPTALATRQEILAKYPKDFLVFGTTKYTPPVPEVAPQPPKSMVPIINQFEEIGKDLSISKQPDVKVGQMRPDGTIETGFPKQVWALADVKFDKISTKPLSGFDLRQQQLTQFFTQRGVTPATVKPENIIISLTKPYVQNLVSIKDNPVLKNAVEQVSKFKNQLEYNRFETLQQRLDLAKTGTSKLSSSDIVTKIDPQLFIESNSDIRQLKNIINSSNASSVAKEAKLQQIYAVEGRLAQLDLPRGSKFRVDFLNKMNGMATVRTLESIMDPPTALPISARTSSILPQDWTARYPQFVFQPTRAPSEREMIIKEEKLKSEPEKVTIERPRYASAEVEPIKYLNKFSTELPPIYPESPSPLKYIPQSLPPKYEPYKDIYTPQYLPKLPYTPPYKPDTYVPPAYTPPEPYKPYKTDYTPYGYDYTKYPEGYTPPYPYNYYYTGYPTGYIPGYIPGKYTAPPTGEPKAGKQKADGKPKKTRPLIQFKSSLFRKFAFGEKDLLVNQQDIAAFKNIIAQKGTFLGYDLVPTREQISREEARLLKSQGETKGLKDKSFLGIKV